MKSFRAKTSFLFALALGLAGCCSGVKPETINMTRATWEGKPGTAATITQSGGTKELEGVKSVSFKLCGRSRDNDLWLVADFTVPVMKVEPNSVTLFFSTDPLDTTILEQLPVEVRAGKVRISGCHPDRIC